MKYFDIAKNSPEDNVNVWADLTTKIYRERGWLGLTVFKDSVHGSKAGRAWWEGLVEGSCSQHGRPRPEVEEDRPVRSHLQTAAEL